MTDLKKHADLRQRGTLVVAVGILAMFAPMLYVASVAWHLDPQAEQISSIPGLGALQTAMWIFLAVGLCISAAGVCLMIRDGARRRKSCS